MNVTPRPGRVLKKLREGKVANCFKVNLDGARSSHLAAMAGFDCLWADREHIGSNWSELEAQIMAAKTQDCDTLVRVARGSYSDYVRPLELDAAGIMVPHCMSEADARNIVKMTRFQPIGRRPIDGGNADGLYATLPVPDYMRLGNEDRFVIAQIEDIEAMDELDAIAAVPGIDMLFFGPADFVHSLGTPGDFTNPTMLEARKRVAKVCRDNGKWAGVPASPANLDEMISLGFRFMCMGADVLGLANYCTDMVNQFVGKDNPGD